jgi:hypothetical protein
MFSGSLPPASNRADWSEVFEVFDDETGDQIDLSDAVIVFDLRASGCAINAAITLVDTGKFTASFTRDQLKQLCAGTYEIGCTLSRADTITQEFIGTLPVLDGVVR